ncbi:malto-oligosyltrehalose trehalohydrolase [Mastigocoleus testarum]|uniref:Malto-oligosyltrehalose trehalohydrolase n=1 Tax=Mastigocoleus testarum BC008 TaxID=371196 RepID=A0A0V7ZXV1_9CYAN|nr:malto-oligosyltrehalose trehalohydrolase [Mastigocoleus testarum]KST69255.1 malto-oligosyltrehalose trehalohydrolase [Mastigocoleus testarum BC008]KST69291.1 malto-oligosyltrehalose trehalohydrolase [Mastigocoleus testarum BC008]
MRIGSQYLGNNICKFTLWAPLFKEVAVHLLTPQEKIVSLERTERGYWEGEVAGVEPGTLYFYQIDGEDRADPASNSQPKGVHGPSEVLDSNAFTWNDRDWKGIPVKEMVIYELHVGTFTSEGTFTAIIEKLSYLRELGVNAIEIMPVAQFPGERNWGYDGVFPYAVQNSYGGVNGLKQLVDACHQQGIAVILDVVYNHLGPEGNYLWGLQTYFTDKYKTPWGSAINYDDAHSDGVRNYFVENVLYWLNDYHIDALRLDAVHAIYDCGAKHILQEMAEAVTKYSQDQGRKYYLIAESDLNDPRIIRSQEVGGYGVDAQWSDDFHHILHTLLTKENQGYYADFGKLEQLAKIYCCGYVYTWDYSEFRQRYHGNVPSDCKASQFVVCAQNHDQVGNRMLGDRLTGLISFEAQKIAAAVVLLSPFVPMLFMGEEYGETAPFLYFVSHGDPGLIEAVREGRKNEFAAFHAEGEAPDPQAEETFKRSRLNWDLHRQGKHKILWQFYQKLLQLRRQNPALAKLDCKQLEVSIVEPEKVLCLRRWEGENQVVCWINFDSSVTEISTNLPEGNWEKLLDSAESKWGGEGSNIPQKLNKQDKQVKNQKISLNPHSVVVYTN